jgi:glycosyltransferase involved in cell wall biosynthesis
MTSSAATPRILVVAYNFPPDASVGTQRTLRLVQHLSGTGWNVRVLTGDPTTFRSETPVDRHLMERVPSTVEVRRAPAWRPLDRLVGALQRLRVSPAHGHGRARQRGPTSPSTDTKSAGGMRAAWRFADSLSRIPDSEAGWIIPAIVQGWFMRRHWKPAVIYSSAPPWSGHLVAATLAALTGAPWIADFRDPWARAPWRSARTPWIGNLAAGLLERFVVRRAQSVICATEAALREYASFYGDPGSKKFVLVPNGCDPSIFDGLAGRPPHDRFVILHAGTLYGERSPAPILRAFAEAFQRGRLDRRRCRLRLVGHTGASEDLSRSITALNLGDVVELVPRLSHRQSLAEMRSASALLLLQQGTSMSIPAKLYEYFAAGRPILAVTESEEIGRIVRESGAGVAFEPGDAQGIEDALVTLSAGEDGLTTAPPSVYDGRLRAAEAAEVLRSAIRAPGDVSGRIDRKGSAAAARARFEVREVDVAKNLDLMLRTHNANFTAKTTLERFEWLYLRNPDGRARAWFVYDADTGDPAGFAAVFPRRIRVRGQREAVVAWNCGDVSVRQRYRGNGAATMLRRAARDAVDRGESPFLYAHPNDRMLPAHLKVGHRPLADMVRLAKPLRLAGGGVVGSVSAIALRGAGLDWAVAARDDVEELQGCVGGEFDELDAAVAPRLGTALVRDATYLNWRFRRCPEYSTAIWTSRRAGRLTGYVVWAEQDRAAVVKDWLAADHRAWSSLFAALVAGARGRELESISVTALETHPDLSRLRRFGFLRRPGSSTAVAYAGDQFPHRRDVMQADAWYMTVGDRDV